MCQKINGLYDTKKSCFQYDVEQCFGACIDKETPENYNIRVKECIAKNSFENQNMVVIDIGRNKNERSAVLIENGTYKGYAFYELNYQITNIEILKKIIIPMQNNKDVRTIIQSYIQEKEGFKNSTVLIDYICFYLIEMLRVKPFLEKLRQKVYIIIYGTNTVSGRLFDLILLGVIVLSVVLVMLETVEGFDTKYHQEVVLLEWTITIFFSIEYILRIITTKKPLRYIFSFYGIIDLIAVLPMYLSLFLTGTSVLTIVRAFRLLRLFKILNHPKFTGQSLHLREALIASRNKIVVFIYFVLISTVFIGSLMYVVEGKESGFTSIPMSIYWTIVTLTTVGYGDISPVTPLGQFIASFVMILGYGIIAVPTGIVSAEIAMQPDKKDNKPKNINRCAVCDIDNQPENANYCYNCGNNLLDD